MKPQIKHIIQNLTPITLGEMDGVSLMKRTDTKFVIHQKNLIEVLETIKDHYSVLQINDKRTLSYPSLYFDTKDKKFYHNHHNGKVNRTKVRMRKYMESNICFLEVKQKDGKGKTTKSRIQINDFETENSAAHRDTLIAPNYFADSLCLSDIILSGTILPAEENSQFTINDLSFRPHMFWAFNKENPVGIYFEVYLIRRKLFVLQCHEGFFRITENWF